MNIVLVGLMGAGKSSVGRILAETLGRPFIDTDALITEGAGCSIPEIFAAEGEAGFRSREAAVVADVAGQDGLVVATGGGVAVSAANREALRRTGVLFWLDASPAELLRRAAAEGVAQRPLLAGADPLGKLEALAQARAGAYAAAAHHRVDAAQPAATVAAAIMAILRAKGGESDAAGEG
ncbi:MAG: shikimate kinase [Firmicutes bacterium]|nr:shikimate kinase [Bacillota bacterium]